MSKFAYDTKLCRRETLMTLWNYRKISRNLLSGQTSGKWISMLINVLWCASDTTTCKATITCPINSCRHRSTAGSRNHHQQNTSKAKTNREKLQSQQSTGVQVQKQRANHPIIQIPSPPTSWTCSTILVHAFKKRHW